MHRSLLLVTTVLVLLQATPAHGQSRGRRVHGAQTEEAVRDFIYYDYVEDGILRGGVVRIDANDPLLANVPDELEGADGAASSSTSTAVTLVHNGPPSNRVDIAFVGDGYTAGQLGSYAEHVDAIYPSLLAEPPFDAYASYFNIHRVDVISNESGVDHDPNQGISRDTALDMGFWCSGIERLLCVNTTKAFTKAAAAPGRDQVLAVANSTKYGGAGYTNMGTLAGNNGAAVELALHEFGHAFGDLADEYWTNGVTYTGGEPQEWNASTFTEAELQLHSYKWHYWLDLPHVSTFEGCIYSQFGAYRPTANSKMRSLGRPFDEVNAEKLIREIYEQIDPIDGASSSGVYTTADSLFVTPMQPVFHSLDVQWSVDGYDVPGATGNTLVLEELGLPVGIYTVSVLVVDNTPMVRRMGIRYLRMTSTRSWTFLQNQHDNARGSRVLTTR